MVEERAAIEETAVAVPAVMNASAVEVVVTGRVIVLLEEAAVAVAVVEEGDTEAEAGLLEEEAGHPKEEADTTAPANTADPGLHLPERDERTADPGPLLALPPSPPLTTEPEPPRLPPAPPAPNATPPAVPLAKRMEMTRAQLLTIKHSFTRFPERTRQH